MKKYSVCYSDSEGFDWCIVNEFDRPILHGVGNMPTMSDIVEAANRWSNHLAEPNTAEVARLNIKLAYKGDEVSTLAAEVERLRASVGCAYCATVFKIDDPLQFDHWRKCEKHPARLELERLQRENEAMREALEKIRDKAKSWEGRKDAPYWNLGDIAAGTLKRLRAALGGE